VATDRRRTVSAEVIPLHGDDEREVSRVPPMDMDAEAGVISAILLAPSLLSVIGPWLEPHHFYSEAHRRIYEAACELHRAGAQVDTTTVGTWLKDRNRIAQIGGMSYITELLAAAPVVTARSINAYAATVFDKWRQRTAIARMQTLVAEGYIGVPDTQGYLDASVRSVEAIARKRAGEPDETNAQLLSRMLHELSEAPDATKSGGIPTGLATYDRLTGGLYRGRKTLIVARTGRGKTTLALMFALSVARRGIGAHVIATDTQTRKEILAKLVCGLAGVEMSRWRDRTLNADDWRRVTSAASELAQLPICIEHIPRATPTRIRHAIMMRADMAISVDKKPIGLVVVDHLHEQAPEPHLRMAKKQEQLEHAARMTGDIVSELNIALIELAQMRDLDRDAGKRAKPMKPRLGCTAWAPQDIEKTAHNIVALWEPDPARIEDVQVEILKAREGRRGTVKLRFKTEAFYEREDHMVHPDVDDVRNPALAASRRYVDVLPPPPDSAPLPPDPNERGTE
jgi:replicative DNA helicase